MRNPFKISLEKELQHELASLERKIVSAELDLITRERHVEELYEKKDYLNWRINRDREMNNAKLPDAE